MVHDFQKKQVADLFAQFNPQPEKPPEPEEPEDPYAGVKPWDIPALKLEEAVSEPEPVSVVMLKGMNPHLCEVRFQETMAIEGNLKMWAKRPEAEKILEDANYFFHSWYIKGDRKLGKIYMKG